MTPEADEPTTAARLAEFLARFDATGQDLFRAARAALQQRLPLAFELFYNYGHAVVVSYSPTERGHEGLVSVALRDDGVRLYLAQPNRPPDPKKLLRGSGKQVRYIPLAQASMLADPDVVALLAAAVAQSEIPWPTKGHGQPILRSDSASKRPRRKST